MSAGSGVVNTLRRGVAPFVAVRFLAFVADQGSTFLIPLAVFSLTGSVALSGLAFTVQWAPRIFLSPVLGAVVDRFATLPQVMLADSLRALLLFGVVAFPDPTLMIVVSGGLTIANGYASILTEQVLSTAVAKTQVAGAQSQQQMAFQTAVMLGPALGAWVFGLVSLTVAASAFALIFLVACVATTGVLASRSPGLTGTTVTQGVWQGLMHGADSLFRQRSLGVLMAITVLVNLPGGLALAALPVVILGQMGGTETTAGTVAGVAAAFGILAATLCAWLTKKYDIASMLAPAFGLLVAGVGAMALAGNAATFGLGYTLWSGGIVVFTVWMRTRRLQLIDPAIVGSALGFFVAVILASAPLAGVILAVAGPLVDVQALLGLMGAGCGIALLPLWWLWRREKGDRMREMRGDHG